ALAGFAYRRPKDLDRARALLGSLPQALFSDFGGADDLAAVLLGTRRLRTVLDQLMRDLIAAGTMMTDLRLVAEMKRDAIGRLLSGRVSSTPRAPAAADRP